MKSISQALCRAADAEVLQTAWGGISWTISRQMGNSDTMMFGTVTILAGHENPRHRHPNCDEILHVVSGRIAHTLGNEQSTMEPGDTIAIAKGVWHQARALEGADAHLVICFSSPERFTELDPSAQGVRPRDAME